MNGFLNLSQLRQIENEALKNNINLIERAGQATALWINTRFNKKTRILIIAGRGNNGCDGLAAAIQLQEQGYKVDTIRLFKDNTAANQSWFNKLQSLKKKHSKIPC